MARGGRKTPPTNFSPIITHIHSDPSDTTNIATTSQPEPITTPPPHAAYTTTDPSTPLMLRPKLDEIIQNSHRVLTRAQARLERIQNLGDQLSQINNPSVTPQEGNSPMIGTPNYRLHNILTGQDDPNLTLEGSDPPYQNEPETVIGEPKAPTTEQPDLSARGIWFTTFTT
jgi:hypothetical protein